MDQVIDQLKSLQYIKRLCHACNLRPLTRDYFAAPQANANEQFYYFAALCAWLLRELGRRDVPMPNQFDDPSTIAEGLAAALSAARVDYGGLPPIKLQAAHGTTHVHVLEQLAERAAAQTITAGATPIVHTHEYDEPAPVDYGAEVVADERIAPSDDGHGDSDAEGEDLAAIDDETPGSRAMLASAGSEAGDLEDAPAVDAAAWRAETSRVAPQLHVALSHGSGGWRVHVEQLCALVAQLDDSLPSLGHQARRVSKDVGDAMARIRTEEKRLNAHFGERGAEHRQLTAEYAHWQEQYNQGLAKVDSLVGQLDAVSAALDAVKTRIDDAGTKKNDTASVADLRRAAAQLRSDIQRARLRTGVVSHALFVAKKNARMQQVPLGSLASSLV